MPSSEEDPEGRGERFAKQGKGVREVLQAVEDALMDAGYSDFMVATEHGSFHWQTVERARQAAQDESGDPNEPS